MCGFVGGCCEWQCCECECFMCVWLFSGLCFRVFVVCLLMEIVLGVCGVFLESVRAFIALQVALSFGAC